MNPPNVDALLHRFGYAPARSTQTQILRGLGFAALGAVAGAVVVALVKRGAPQLQAAVAEGVSSVKESAHAITGKRVSSDPRARMRQEAKDHDGETQV